jgi:hypothetical protein
VTMLLNRKVAPGKLTGKVRIGSRPDKASLHLIDKIPAEMK